MEYEINVGPLTSTGSLYYYLANSLQEIRSASLKGQNPNVRFDLRYIIYPKVNLSALTAFLSLSRKIREATGKPSELIINWEPNMLRFLTDVDFFFIARKLDIFQWDENMIGGFVSGKTNPNTKLLYFGDVNSVESIKNHFDSLSFFKKQFKQKITPNFSLRCSEILRGFSGSIINLITNTTIELIVNCLIHGEDVAFVGLQRTSKRITITVCDSGVGFKKSLNKYLNKDISHSISHSQALLIGSMMQQEEHGLRLAISQVLNYSEEYPLNDLFQNEGWVIMSSFDTEIRWQKANWSLAKEAFDSVDLHTLVPSMEYFLGEKKVNYNTYESLGGHWKIFSNFLIGSRITFEIPL